MTLDLCLLCKDIKDTASDFRVKTDVLIEKIYGYLEHPSAGTAHMIEGWKKEFAYLYGDTALLPADREASGSRDAALLFYAVQTCFSILVKAVMRQILDGVRRDDSRSGEALLRGEFAVRHGIRNYIRPDRYWWPLYEMENGFGGIIEELTGLLSAYERETLSEAEGSAGHVDYIRQMYASLIPKEIRHALGEFYTPDKLAERMLGESMKYAKTPLARLRIADPTCGSGTFLIQAVYRKKQEGCTLADILSSVYGFDINPLAVLTAKTNYLLAVADLIGQGEIELPVYRADILGLADPGLWEDGSARCGEAAGEIPLWALSETDGDWRALNDLEPFDLILGNPPWVNWEYLPKEYRNRSRHLWREYGLFHAKGRDLSFSKEDISVLITYVVMDKLLKNHGILGFVVRQGMFKSASNGVGFRRFRIREEYAIRVLRVEDLSRVKVFEDAAVNAALFWAEKGAETVYPVPYLVWEKQAADVSEQTSERILKQTPNRISDRITVREEYAMPAAAQDPASVWVTADKNRLEKLRRVLGSNPYRARTGVFTGGANGVYWLQICGREGGRIRVRNLVERAKRKVEQVETELEADYVFPMIKGSNVRRWQVSYDTYLLCPHTEQTKMWPVPAEALRESCPLTYAYLNRFRGELDVRKGFAGWEKEIQRQEFHAVLRVGEYTFSRYKVIWKYIAPEFICAVLDESEDPYLGRRVCLPNEKIMYVSVQDETEAYYLCGILSSSLVSECVKGYMNPTSISAHVLDKLKIPAFDAHDPRHRTIADACREGHKRRYKKGDLRPYLDKIDEIVEQIYSREGD
ncbi:MAG: N-6 DNA methylase [Muribaculum sp.]|nr:N-6 DNA methylase [Muribaculum sp.]